MADAATINVLLSSFPGLGLPTTLCLPVSSKSTIYDLTSELSTRLPVDLRRTRLILTTSSNKQLSTTSNAPIQSLLSSPADSILPLRLSAPLCGGKGGFGSQLRAQGGRMSSKKKKSKADAATSSSRNLDGRRLRTVNEAKALAEYLSIKPEMDKKEKEERRQKWELVVQSAEAREAEIRAGRGGRDKGDGKWIEEKEDVEAKVREEIKEAMAKNLLAGSGTTHSSDESVNGSEGSEDDSDGIIPAEAQSSTPKDKGKGKAPAPTSRKVWGWDDDEDEDEDMSEGEEA